MKDFLKTFLAKDKVTREGTITNLKKYRDRYLPVKLYSSTKEGQEMNQLIEMAEANLTEKQ